jgi:hypothetical protein
VALDARVEQRKESNGIHENTLAAGGMSSYMTTSVESRMTDGRLLDALESAEEWRHSLVWARQGTHVPHSKNFDESTSASA